MNITKGILGRGSIDSKAERSRVVEVSEGVRQGKLLKRS